MRRVFRLAMSVTALRQALIFVGFLAWTSVAIAAAPAPAKLIVPKGFSGAVLVARGSTVLLSEAHGSVGRVPIRLQSKFWVASAGKQFVAAAIMKLVERGKVRLDDPLSRFLPEAPRDKAGITVRQLLSHTSGFSQSYVSEEQTTRAEAVRRMLAEPLAGIPGIKFGYSNINIQLAAAIIEAASGMPYGQFVQRELWVPAGLRRTGQAGDRGARSVMPTTGALPRRLGRHFWGEQGVYSTVVDLFRWYRALDRGQLLQPASVAEMFKPVVKIGEGYATEGWFRGTTASGNDFIFVRGNEDFGANGLLYAYPQQDVVIVVLTHAGDVPGKDTSWSRYVHHSLEQQLGL